MASELLQLLDGLWHRYVSVIMRVSSDPAGHVLLAWFIAIILTLALVMWGINLALMIYRAILVITIHHNAIVQYRKSANAVSSPIPTITKRKPVDPDSHDSDSWAYGYVYLIHSENGQYKIGIAGNPLKRLASLQTASSFPLKLICAIPSKSARQAELNLHKKYADKRAHGEWFSLSNDDVKNIRMSLLDDSDEINEPAPVVEIKKKPKPQAATEVQP